MSEQREMTLDEWCQQLPGFHLVNRELSGLRAELAEAQKDALRYRLLRTLLMMRMQETMHGTRRYGLVIRPGYSFLDALGDPARAYLNPKNFDDECGKVDEAIDAAMTKGGA